MQLSNIIGLPVYSIYECERVGYVLNIILGHKFNKICHLIISDEENEAIYTVNMRNIYKINDECILIRNKTKLSVNSVQSNNIINNTVITLEGKKDVVQDVLLDQGFNVEKIECQKTSFGCNDILCNANNILILKNNNTNIKRKNFRPRPKKINVTSVSQPVSILDNITRPTPLKVNSSGNIIGKHLSNNLYSHQNEILATKGSLINQNTINLARQFGVVNQLIALAK